LFISKQNATFRPIAAHLCIGGSAIQASRAIKQGIPVPAIHARRATPSQKTGDPETTQIQALEWL